MILQRDNCKLYFETKGQGDPFIIIHGGPGLDHTYLTPWLDFLSEYYTLIYLDLRGHGKSVCQDLSSISHKVFVEDISYIQEYFSAEVINLFGHSYGGMVALEFAASKPKQVSHLILCNSVIGNRFPTVKMRLNSKNQAEWFALMKTPHCSIKKKQQELVYTFANYLYSCSFEDAIRLVGSMASNDEIFHHIRSQEYPKFILENFSRNVSAKTLIISGKHDALPLENSYSLNKEIKGSQIYILEKSGHFPFFEEPNAFKTIVLNWIRAER